MLKEEIAFFVLFWSSFGLAMHLYCGGTEFEKLVSFARSRLCEGSPIVPLCICHPHARPRKVIARGRAYCPDRALFFFFGV